jgi:hypothetical protein
MLHLAKKKNKTTLAIHARASFVIGIYISVRSSSARVSAWRATPDGSGTLMSVAVSVTCYAANPFRSRATRSPNAIGSRP